MFDLLPPQDVGDAKVFHAAVIATFASYPQQVRDIAPIAIAHRSDRPTLKLIREVCEELWAPIARKMARQPALDALRDFVAHRRTPEQQARIDQQVASVRSLLGIPNRNKS